MAENLQVNIPNSIIHKNFDLKNQIFKFVGHSKLIGMLFNCKRGIIAQNCDLSHVYVTKISKISYRA